MAKLSSATVSPLGDFLGCLVLTDKLLTNPLDTDAKAFNTVLNQLSSGNFFKDRVIIDVTPSTMSSGELTTAFIIGPGSLYKESYIKLLEELCDVDHFQSRGELFTDALFAKVLSSNKFSYQGLFNAWFDMNNGVFLTLDERVQEDLFNILCDQKLRKKAVLESAVS